VAASPRATAVTLHVNCGQRTGLTSIGAAIKALKSAPSLAPATILVSGACRENLVIDGLDRITLTAVNGASINDASGGKLDVLVVSDSRDVSITGFTINAGADGISGANGIYCTDVSVCRLSANVIQGAADGYGFLLALEAVGRLNGDILQGNGAGIGVFTTSKVQGESFTARGNGNGIEVIRGEATLNNCTIENNNGDGAFVKGGALLNVNSCSASRNGSTGVEVASASYVRLGTASITGNGGNGVVVGDLSMVDLQGSNVSGNLSTPDVSCHPQYSATRGAGGIGGGTTNCSEPSVSFSAAARQRAPARAD
jgi:hypothetical protein